MSLLLCPLLFRAGSSMDNTGVADLPAQNNCQVPTYLPTWLTKNHTHLLRSGARRLAAMLQNLQISLKHCTGSMSSKVVVPKKTIKKTQLQHTVHYPFHSGGLSQRPIYFGTNIAQYHTISPQYCQISPNITQ
jgi:hypothetical protein